VLQIAEPMPHGVHGASRSHHAIGTAAGWAPGEPGPIPRLVRASGFARRYAFQSVDTSVSETGSFHPKDTPAARHVNPERVIRHTGRPASGRHVD